MAQPLMLDDYGCAKAKLEDLDLINRILDEFPARIAKTKIMPPYGPSGPAGPASPRVERVRPPAGP